MADTILQGVPTPITSVEESMVAPDAYRTGLARRAALVLLIGALGCGPGSPTVVVAPNPDGFQIDSATIQASRDTLRGALRSLVTAQEAYFADFQVYALSLRQLREYWRGTPGLVAVILTATNDSHSEIALLTHVPGLTCAIFIGPAARPFGLGEEGVPTCRGP